MQVDNDGERIAWRPIDPLPEDQALANGALGALEALRQEWNRQLSEMTEAQRVEVRRRTLRRLAVETGILERLYEIEWGLTLTLVAEGFSRDVVERAGGRIDDLTMAALEAQRDSLEMVMDVVREQRPLTPHFIRELHASITRHQPTYVVTDTLGRVTTAPLPHGAWKTQPNHVRRGDGRLLEYAPPEQVQSEIERLIALWNELEASAAHPVVRASWLHHRFVQIHPFADGNGRVARALTVLALARHRYAPLVVDRFHRGDYLDALERANEGDLRALIGLFVRLEQASLTTELDRPDLVEPQGTSSQVARTLAAQLAERRRRLETQVQRECLTRARLLEGRMRAWLTRKGQELEQAFGDQGLATAMVFVDLEFPPSEKAGWMRRQVIASARVAGHFANLDVFAGWGALKIRAEGWDVRFVASVHGVGRAPGVVGVTTFGQIGRTRRAPDDEVHPETFDTTKDAFRVVHTESPEQVERRAGELDEILDQGLAVVLARLSQQLR